jgi:hypothetical protein
LRTPPEWSSRERRALARSRNSPGQISPGNGAELILRSLSSVLRAQNHPSVSFSHRHDLRNDIAAPHVGRSGDLGNEKSVGRCGTLGRRNCSPAMSPGVHGTLGTPRDGALHRPAPPDGRRWGPPTRDLLPFRPPLPPTVSSLPGLSPELAPLDPSRGLPRRGCNPLE